MQLTGMHWLVLNITAFMYGFNKTGIVGSAIVCTPMMLLFFTPGTVLGILVPLLVVADIMTVALLRRDVIWRHICRALPWAILGIVIGWQIAKATTGLGDADQTLLRKIIAGVLIFLLLFGYVVRLRPNLVVPAAGENKGEGTKTWFAAVMGTMAGITTMLANNGGPAWVVYLSSLGMSVREFLSTAAWLFFIQNLTKVPFAVNLGFVTRDTLWINLWLIPALLLGLAVGNRVSKRISKKVFTNATQILAMLGALYLLLR